MKINKNNYFSKKANLEYMGVSQYKQFMKCEAAAMAELREEYKPEMTTALLVGSYVDAYFEGTLENFVAEHPEILKRDGTLKADYVQAENIINRVKQDELFMKFMSGRKQVIKTAELFGTKWKIKIDSYFPKDKIVDLKIMRSLERIMGRSFVDYWGYDIQMAVYSEIERLSTPAQNKYLETYLAVATKETPTDLELIHIPLWRRKEVLQEVEKNMPRILAVKSGKEDPHRCGTCAYCRATKKLTEPIDFELVGLTAEERRMIQ